MRLSVKERRTRGFIQCRVQEIRGISRVFREMWDTADLHPQLFALPVLSRLQIIQSQPRAFSTAKHPFQQHRPLQSGEQLDTLAQVVEKSAVGTFFGNRITPANLLVSTNIVNVKDVARVSSGHGGASR
jgi:hypothetical protein